MPAIIVKNYSYVSQSFPNWDTPQGRIVKNKAHYERLMKENNMVAYEQAQDQAKSHKLKPYILNKKTRDFISEVKLTADSKGRVRLGERAVNQLVKMKAIGNPVPDYMKLPSAYNK